MSGIRVASVGFVCALLVAGNGCSSGSDFQPSGDGGAAGSTADSGVGGATGGNAGTGAKAGTGGTAGTGSSAGTGGSAGSGGTGGTLVTGTDPNGTSCSAGSSCKSGYCVDGVCCETACDGACTACNVKGKEGSCSPYAENSDPEGDCRGTGKAGDTCVGACDGQGACKMPDKQTSCGASTCSAGSQSSYVCDGKGGCALDVTPCGLYQCSTQTCMNQCGGASDCVADAWCNAGQCEAKKDNGQSCGGDGECKSGACAGGTCCNVACNSPMSCSTGTCTCGGQTCGAGDQCILWYEDSDGDGHGDVAKPQPGCASAAPVVAGKKFVKSSDDCYDNNKLAYPGSTVDYQEADRGDGSFDYNCDGQESKKVANVAGLSCVDCHEYTSTNTCSVTCGTGTLSGVLYSMGFVCNSPSSSCFGVKVKQGFIGNVACGQPSMMMTCAVNSCSTTAVQAGTQKQACR